MKSIYCVLVTVVMAGCALTDVGAKPGGRYVCKARKLEFNGMAWGPNTPLILRIPNGKGSLRGTFKGAGTIGLMGNTPITGRISGYRSAQGGKKHILRGQWNWKLKQNALSGNAGGKVRLIVQALSRGGYQVKGGIRIRNVGAMPYLVIGDIKGE